MNISIKEIIKWGTQHPKKLFKIDGIGAIASAVLLGIVLVEFEPFFGIPKSVLYFLALLPCLFTGYDFYCCFILRKNITPFLKGIAYTNLIYCCLSLGLTFYHRNSTTVLGWMYIITECIIIILLVRIELEVAKRISTPIH
ncbi:MAG: hypothetical protein MUC49_07495 [Raineya sp.]|jgi:hypothetical protein|nr:hypothetical protein [Raineya sp.]